MVIYKNWRKIGKHKWKNTIDSTIVEIKRIHGKWFVDITKKWGAGFIIDYNTLKKALSYARRFMKHNPDGVSYGEFWV